jgi:hypothetical protein
MKRRLSLLLGAAMSVSACIGGTEPPDPAVDDRWEAFRQSALLISADPVSRYVFGGDMVAIGEDGLRREYERYFGTSAATGGDFGEVSSPLTVDRVNGADVLLAPRYSDSGGGRYDLTYCIQRNTFSAAELVALETALGQATESWNGLVNVAFRHEKSQDASCGPGNTNVFFHVRGVSGAPFFAAAFFPDYPRSARELMVDDAAFTTTSGGRDLQGILRHETGHILGFRHEHIWLGDCSAEGIGDARHVTPYDEGSVMHYPQCRDSGIGGYRQTRWDYQGAIKLYGLATAQVIALL